MHLHIRHLDIRRLADYFGAHTVLQRDAHERDRARQRVVIATVFGLVAGWSALDPGAGAFERAVPWLCGLYVLCALVHLIVLLPRALGVVAAQYLFIVLDPALTLLAVIGSPSLLAAFYPVAMVLVVRCGVRYGVRTLWLGWTSAALTAALLMPASHFWMAEPQLLRSFMVTLVIVPVLFGPLITRLHQVTDDLRTAAGSDPLTGLGNRRMLTEHLRQARARSARDGTLLAVILFDLDNFKGVNDRQGHAAGDQLLGQVADAIRATCRAGDFAARVGGDEFVLLIEGLPVPDGSARAVAIATDIVRQAHAAAERLVPGAEVSASAGVHCWAHGLGAEQTEAELIDRADRAMYDAKRAGKGRVVLAEA